MAQYATFLLLVAQLAAAHFSIEYPEWRGDSLKNTSYSQYTFPCKLSTNSTGI